MRVVFDTNVLIAAFLTEGVCSKLLIRARRGECDLFLSDEIIREFKKNLQTKFFFSTSEINEACAVLLEAAEDTVQKVNPIPPICRDPTDDKILACAKQTGADYLVTGDQDLLAIKRHDRTRIVTPRTFEDTFED